MRAQVLAQRNRLANLKALHMPNEGEALSDLLSCETGHSFFTEWM
jgi:hypothetical protein